MEEIPQQKAAENTGEADSTVTKLMEMVSVLRASIEEQRKKIGVPTVDHISAAQVLVESFDRQYSRGIPEFQMRRSEIVQVVRELLHICLRQEIRLSEGFQRFIDGPHQ